MHERSGRIKIPLSTQVALSAVFLTPKYKHRSCAGGESLVIFLSVKGRERVERLIVPKALNRKRVKIVGNLLHVSSYRCLISYTLSVERIVV